MCRAGWVAPTLCYDGDRARDPVGHMCMLMLHVNCIWIDTYHFGRQRLQKPNWVITSED
jgi:hypothetical protein